MPNATDENEEVIDADTSEYAAEIPSKLYQVVLEVYDRLQSAHIERKIGSSWRSSRKRFNYGSPPPSQTVEEICARCVETVTELTDKMGKDTRFRVCLTYSDPSKSTKVARRFVPIEAEIMEDGEVLVTDGSELSERDHLSILRDVIEKQTERHDRLFDKAMEMLDKSNDNADKMVAQATAYASGIATIGNSLGGVVNASTATLEKAARLFQDKEKEHVAIQLAKMDAQAEQGKMNAVLMLLNKVGGPIAKQITAVIGGGDGVTGKAKAVAKEKVQQAIAGDKKSPENSGKDPNEVPVEERAPSDSEKKELNSCQKLTVWLGSLEEEVAIKVQEIIGEENFNGFLAASEAGTAEGADAALLSFKRAFDKIAQEDAEELAKKMMALSNILGDARTEVFARMLPD